MNHVPAIVSRQIFLFMFQLFFLLMSQINFPRVSVLVLFSNIHLFILTDLMSPCLLEALPHVPGEVYSACLLFFQHHLFVTFTYLHPFTPGSHVGQPSSCPPGPLAAPNVFWEIFFWLGFKVSQCQDINDNQTFTYSVSRESQIFQAGAGYWT